MNKTLALKELAKDLSILFIDDDTFMRETTYELLKNLFDSIQTAEDGEIGLYLYKEQYQKTGKYFDIVISDIQMPHMDGITLSKEIFKINKEQKVLIISAHDDKEYLIEFINIGIDGFILKPLLKDNLFSSLMKICLTISAQKELSRFLLFADDYKWDYKEKVLFKSNEVVKLSENETSLFQLFSNNINQKFTNLEIFDYLFMNIPEKEFSSDIIKSIIKRIRKKLPKDIIESTPLYGYSLKITI